MIKSYSKSEMKKLWRRAAGLEPQRTDCMVDRTDGVDVDAMIEPRMRAWYLNLLDRAPVELLRVEDVAEEVIIRGNVGRPGGLGTLPGRVRRLLSIRQTGWLTATVPRSAEEAAETLRRSLNPYLQPGPAVPLCVMLGRDFELQPYEDGDVVVSARAITDPGPENYVLDESLLASIPDILKDYDNF
ncbi:MAG: hypothetical protein K2M12_04255 [Muribaculaceae bacterium]|nr:hypothetical protein [Muribaculaceae bacterium]